MSYIIGISCFFHDSAACLINDGEIISAVQEERFTRIKHDSGFPSNSINYLLYANNIKLSNIDKVVFYEKPFLKFERILETYIKNIPYGFKSFKKSLPIWIKEKLFLKSIINNELKKIDTNFNKKNIAFSEHHLSHASSAFFPSPFNKAIILTIDGVGEDVTTSVAIGEGNSIDIKKEIHFPHSLGLLYSAFTYYLGFKVNSGEYKLMGLAPYGEPIFKDIILKKLMNVLPDGSFELDQSYFDYQTGLRMTNSKFDKLFNGSFRKDEKEIINENHLNIAASIQAVVEEIILKISKNLFDEFQIENLCLAGGVALNCVSNGKLLKSKLFNNIWIQPAAGDAGGCIGAALSYWYIEKNNKRIHDNHDKMKGSYLGPNFSSMEIKNSLTNSGAIFIEKDFEEVLSYTASSLSQGKVCAWFQDRMEFGPRALGNRSILADPRSAHTQKELNLKVKYRESFRPFAPAIIEEDLHFWFDLEDLSPYMLLVGLVKKDKLIQLSEDEKKLVGLNKLKSIRSQIPAVTHVDNSARIQTVSRKTNEKFYKLLCEFKKQTNCPVLVNTSFNIRNEPIVCTPEDAYRCFMSSEIDLLIINNFVIKKEDQIQNLISDRSLIFEND